MPGQSCVLQIQPHVCVHTHTHSYKRVIWSASSHTKVPYMLSCCLHSLGKAGNTTKPKINRGLSASWGPGLPSLGPGLSGAAGTPVYAWSSAQDTTVRDNSVQVPIPAPAPHSLGWTLLPGTWWVLYESCCERAPPAEAETGGRDQSHASPLGLIYPGKPLPSSTGFLMIQVHTASSSEFILGDERVWLSPAAGGLRPW